MLLGCDAGSAPADAVAADPVALATRASIDLRGVRPSIEEANRAQAGEVEALVAEWLVDPRFGDQVGSIYADVLLTRADAFLTRAVDYGLPEEAPFVTAVGEAPVRTVAEIADEDRSWTEAVTGDWTMATEVMAGIWPVAYPSATTGWQRVAWTDARPAAGILATNSFYWRYTSTESNANRGRAGAISRIFLCNDYTSRAIPFDRTVDLSDAAAVADALDNNAACVSCHVSLDPLAANLFGFWYRFDEDPYERARYHHDREGLYEDYLGGVPPGYFGVPEDGLAALGRAIAADDRFPTCAVETVYRGVLQRELTVDDTDALRLHRNAFVTGGARFRDLYRSILADPAYAAAPAHQLSADQLASTVEGLTGFRMTRDDWDLLRNDAVGFRMLAGGLDGVDATARVTTPTPTLLLVQERLAEAASVWAVESGLIGSATRPPERADVVSLARQATGQAWSDETADGLLAVTAGMDPVDAWTTVLTGVLRDPAALVY